MDHTVQRASGNAGSCHRVLLPAPQEDIEIVYPLYKPNRESIVRLPVRKGRRSQRMWSFRRLGGSETQLASSDVVPVVGLEPTRCRHRRILNPLRLPFHHTGTLLRVYNKQIKNSRLFFFAFGSRRRRARDEPQVHIRVPLDARHFLRKAVLPHVTGIIEIREHALRK